MGSPPRITSTIDERDPAAPLVMWLGSTSVDRRISAEAARDVPGVPDGLDARGGWVAPADPVARADPVAPACPAVQAAPGARAGPAARPAVAAPRSGPAPSRRSLPQSRPSSAQREPGVSTLMCPLQVIGLFLPAIARRARRHVTNRAPPGSFAPGCTTGRVVLHRVRRAGGSCVNADGLRPLRICGRATR